ncbi:hypothetical protein [Mesoplasma seiffertii]|uniref:hypothetical protein n=1 Tax=Mesoplasma seiffertii TaxID=28224 RepID=UPI0004788C8E|nr:hypothetical protein [Mesoplasma seiffertii]
MKQIFTKKSLWLVSSASVYLLVQMLLLYLNKLTIADHSINRAINVINFFVVGTLLAVTIGNFVKFIYHADLVLNHKVSVKTITKSQTLFDFVKSVVALFPILLTKGLYLLFEDLSTNFKFSFYTQVIILVLIIIVLISTIIFGYMLVIYFQNGEYFEDEDSQITILQWLRCYRPKTKDKDKLAAEQAVITTFIIKVIILLIHLKNTVELVFKIRLTNWQILTKKTVSPWSLIA